MQSLFWDFGHYPTRVHMQRTLRDVDFVQRSLPHLVAIVYNNADDGSDQPYDWRADYLLARSIVSAPKLQSQLRSIHIHSNTGRAAWNPFCPLLFTDMRSFSSLRELGYVSELPDAGP